MSLKHLLLLSTIFILGQTTHAQDAIFGTVMDTTENKPIYGALVIIDDGSAGFGAQTDFDGKFNIQGIPPGVHSVTITIFGFTTKKFNSVQVKTGGKTDLGTINMKSDAFKLGGFEIIAERVTGNEAAVLSEMKGLDVIAVGISAEQIKKSPDVNAAESVKRLPGINISEGKFAIVRGLSERYNYVLFNESSMPSSEADMKAFAFDIFPSSVIDRIIVSKTASPDLPGEFAGGVFKIFSKTIPDKNFIHVNYSNSFRSQTTFNPFFEQDNGRYGALGYDDGTYSLPTGAESDIQTLSESDRLALGSKFNNTWLAKEGIAPLDKRLNFSVGRRKELFAKKEGKSPRKIEDFFHRLMGDSVTFGSLYALMYSDTRQLSEGTRFVAKPSLTELPSFNFNESNYLHSTRLGFMANYALRIGSKHNIFFRNLYNHQANISYNYREGFLDDSQADIKDYTLANSYKSLYSSQLNGNHTLSKSLKVDWSIGYSVTDKDDPDTRRYRQTRDAFTDFPYTNIIPPANITPFTFGRIYASLQESILTATANLSYTPEISFIPEFKPTFKAGVFYDLKDRSYNIRNLGFYAPLPIPLESLSLEELFSEVNFNSGTNGLVLNEDTKPDFSYTAGNRNLSYFAMASIPVKKHIEIIGGVRIENNTQSLNSQTGSTLINVNTPIVSVLPSVNFTYKLDDNNLLRAAYSKTLNRPEFREIAPLSYFDFNSFATIDGNPNLKTPSVMNYDVRYEYYPSYDEIVSFGLFYKDFTNPIENYLLLQTNPAFSFTNALSAYSAGAEVEIRKNLVDWFPENKILNKSNVLLNAAYIKSEVQFDPSIASQSASRPMFGQSPYSVNFGYYYTNDSADYNIAVLYNIIGPRIYIVGSRDIDGSIERPDVYQMPRHQVDLTFTKNIKENYELRIAVADILNQNNYFLQDYNQDGVLDNNSSNDVIFNNYKRGSYVTIGFTVKL
jgi:outer membrane receptor protein involved in Fe transport